MVKLVKKPITLDHLSGSLDRLSSLVEKGFIDVRAELSKKADKSDIESLRTELKNDINQLAMATKFGFDEVHNELSLKADKVDLNRGLDGVKQRLSNLDNRLDIFVSHEKRLVKLEHKLNLSP